MKYTNALLVLALIAISCHAAAIDETTKGGLVTKLRSIGAKCHPGTEDCMSGFICVPKNPNSGNLTGKCHRLAKLHEPCEGNDKYPPVCAASQNLTCKYPALLEFLFKKLGKQGKCVYAKPK